MPELYHFKAWADTIVPHLSPRQQEGWASELWQAGHPGFTMDHKHKDKKPEDPDTIKGALIWAWRIIVLLCLLFLCMKPAHAQRTAGDPGGGRSTNDPCQFAAKTWTNINQTAGTQLITGTAGKKTYICYFWIAPIGTATNIALVEGTGSTCGTSTISVSGAGGGSGTAATGAILVANQGFVQGVGGFAVGQATVAADNVCLLQSAANQISGGIVWVQY